jgi:hypothetical protein
MKAVKTLSMALSFRKRRDQRMTQRTSALSNCGPILAEARPTLQS